MSDRFHLDRFVTAQEPVFDRVIAELRNGRKQSHWMWFIFPQIAGLGHSEMARRFAVGGLDEAVAYLGHGLLGPRLLQCTELLLLPVDPLDVVLGHPDDLKFHSCMTLFSAADPERDAFRQALDKYFLGQPDAATLARLAA